MAMAIGSVVTYSDSIASGAATSTGVNLQGGYFSINVFMQTMSTAAAINVWSSPNSGTSFYQIMSVTPGTSTVAANAFVIASGVGSTGSCVQIPGGHSYLQFVTTGVVSGGVQFKIVCSD